MKYFASILIIFAAIEAADFAVYTVIDENLKITLQTLRTDFFPSSGYTPGNVAVFGNSITKNSAFWEPFGRDSSSIVPGTNLKSYQTDKDTSRYCAVGGYLITNGLACIDSALELLKPEVVVFMYGTNDIRDKVIGTFPYNYRTYIDKIKAKGVVPIMSTIPPLMLNNDTTYNPAVREINDTIRAIAKEKGIVLTDYWQAVMDYTDNDPFSSEWYNDEYVHPSSGCDLTDVYEPACGFGLRNAVCWHAVNQVYRIIIDDGDPVQSTARPGRQNSGTKSMLETSPNPFNPQTTITITALKGPEAQRRKLEKENITVQIYNIEGKLIAHFTPSAAVSLPISFNWNALNQTSGIYVVKAKVGNDLSSKCITLIK